MSKVKKLKSEHPKLLYDRLIKMPTKWEKLIAKDVPRTYVGEPFFKRAEY